MGHGYVRTCRDEEAVEADKVLDVTQTGGTTGREVVGSFCAIKTTISKDTVLEV
jgi:hypothetical protein